MQRYEYKVIAAPTRGLKAKGIKTAEARFSHALEAVMNEMAAQGWEYQRAETLPSTERSGLTSTTTKWRNVLVFRRPEVSSATPVTVTEAAPDEPKAEELPEITTPQTPQDDASHSAGASRMLHDNGVEELSDVSGVTTSLKQLAETRKPDKTDD
ncbi:DUF4177 domain-containing protein [Roseobacter denitrificans]|uniref:DUF4177 domain-containing protein n=1 Tax=Roseobacter denitrificans (strain ATCC 33942 / OCh 114) TaxID=375451 RepID=Q163K8_ROSDO|nr:DUF4177 domain-containing protein [Roseobacter denitrificans]ABG32835.1 conserved hypothetical protein [Roseobacter denitrificans OCh 114]AVL52235.1 DUF4177 domain-containing protein [Roseobacter denitrificans]SFF95524.1 protein of unknown function [Roseobacter denitrificans OCh 114]